jgi:2-dehydro-3-deoxygluconokinase
VYIGGAELNVATALAKWEIPVKYCSALPQNYLSREIEEVLKQKNIDTSALQFSGERIGIYFLPQGTDLKHAGVIYDRTHSSFACLQPGQINWDEVLQDCNWFHFSAISPALNETAAAVCLEAVKAAARKGLTISVDLNYRVKLWQYGKKPTVVMPELLNYCQVVMGNIWAAQDLLGIDASLQDSNGATDEQLIAAAAKSMESLRQCFTQIETLAYTFRLSENYFAVLSHQNKLTISQKIKLTNVVDKVGSGDCFMAGLIYGLYQQHSPIDIINFAAAAATGKMQEKGDSTDQTVTSIHQRLQHIYGS